MNKYLDYCKRREGAITSFDIAFCCNEQQFKEEMRRLGISDRSEMIPLGYGRYIRKCDKGAYSSMIKGFNRELSESIEKDDEFVVDMFYSVMSDLEFCISYDVEEVLEACGMHGEAVLNDSRLGRLFKKAQDKYFNNVVF